MGKLGTETQLEYDRRSTGLPDALDALLESTYNLLNRPKLHGHTCQLCGRLRTCTQQPCAYRATDREREWDCGCGGNNVL